MQGIAKSVDAARKRVKNWPIEEDGFRALEPGFKKTFRAAAKAFAAARKRPRPENYHEWRKRVKDHWYHIRLLENLWTDLLRGYENSLEHIETWLGDDHNLTLLHDRLVKQPEKSLDQVLRAIDLYQKELRENAETFGKRVHEEKAGQFLRRMRKLWKDWKAGPKSVREFEKKESKG
jgi:CHAD domain-containing protein